MIKLQNTQTGQMLSIRVRHNVTEENIEQIWEQEVGKYFAKYSRRRCINAQMKLKPLNVSIFPHSDGYTSDKLLLWQYIPFGGVKETFRSF